jgi:hypothetical protein
MSSQERYIEKKNNATIIEEGMELNLQARIKDA